ncbi:MAG: phosphotransferase [Alphaproteobacteria bacterium]|nr:phosphotransferase [Alphaproteobacteria bacterium]
MIDDADLIAAAAPLCQQAKCAPPRGFERLAGGKNNRVWRLDLADGEAVVLKSYYHDPHDPRDRLAAEWAFLTHAWARGVTTCPQPLAIDHGAHLGLYTFMRGVKLSPGTVNDAHVQAALAFVLAVNAPPRTMDAMPPGSEACFSLEQHLTTVDRRIARLETLSPEAPMRAEAERFISARLQPTWVRVRAKILQETVRAEISIDDLIPLSRQIISPSDFGFHNALADGRDLAFIDFEYAGRDDPAKLACDFFCCPEIPAPISLHDLFVDGLVAGLSLQQADAARCRLLLDAYRVKWACIILNVFLPGDAARRAFADHAANAARCAEQLARASAKLDEIAVY